MGRALTLLISLALIEGCASQQCNFHSECGDGFYCTAGRCRQDCRMNLDCLVPGQVCDELGRCVEPLDGSTPPFRDAGRDAAGVMSDSGPRFDAGPMPADSGGPRSDAGPMGGDTGPGDTGPGDTGPGDAGPGTGVYLDRCTLDGDCMSGRCIDDVGGTSMCTITCSTHSDCASEHVCSSGLCQPDNTGRGCSAATAGDCALGLCVGVEPSGHCTRQCGNAGDCPAGYSCALASGMFVCFNIERPCSECPTGRCLPGGLGCTSTCRGPTNADCPEGFRDMDYTCSAGECVPDFSILGPDEIGAVCRDAGVGLATLCRSGLCVTDSEAGLDLCTQACDEEGGCDQGFGCVPIGSELICQRAGTGALLSACSSDSQCDSSFCETPGFCTRLCTIDGLCPTGLTCRTSVGTLVQTCQL